MGRIAMFGLVFVSSGCDPSWNLEVTVTDDRGTLLAGANVTMTCGGSLYERVRSDPKGLAIFGGVNGPYGPGRFSTSCTVSAETAGHTPASMAPTCTRAKGEGQCAAGHATLRLERERL